jgi:hypothetical protein
MNSELKTPIYFQQGTSIFTLRPSSRTPRYFLFLPLVFIPLTFFPGQR